MSADVQWIETSREVYAAIYSEFRDRLLVHGTISRPDDCSFGERLMMTEWGLPGADFPIIRHDEQGNPPEHRFYIAVIKATKEQP